MKEHRLERTYGSTHIWEHTHMGAHTYEPAQPKRTWTCHKSRFVWKCTGKMPDPAVEMHMDISQEPFFAVIYRKKCRTLLTSIKHRAFYCDCKNRFSVATLFGDQKEG